MYSPCYLFTYLSIDLFIYWLRAAACGILDPRPGIEPMPSAVEAYNPTHWPASDFPDYINMSERNSSCVIFFPFKFFLQKTYFHLHYIILPHMHP